MNVLVFNCGSSSLKYKLIRLPSEKTIVGGEAQRVGPTTAGSACILHRSEDGEENVKAEMPDHAAAFKKIMALLNRNSAWQADAIGHRVVHGGEWFADPQRIDAEQLETLHQTESLAPIHNPPAIRLIEACREQTPDLPQVAVFDTAYHSTLPDYASTYALPEKLRIQQKIRKYGFHGTSHAFVVGEAAQMLGIPLESFNAVSCHLGSGGASLCAVRNGCSVDNTMGYSPLQGLMMSTRSGDLDPSLPLRYLMQDNNDAGKVEHKLNKNSGLLGVSGYSPDIRDIFEQIYGENDHAKADSDIERLRLAAQMYIWRIRKYLGAYLTVVGDPDAVIFTDTIGETLPAAREAICRNMGFFGIHLEPNRNRTNSLPADISADDSKVRLIALETDEELAIARRTARLIKN